MADKRGALTALGRTFKQLNAPVGAFGRAAIDISTTALKGSDARYAKLERQLTSLVEERDALVARMEAILDQIPGCASSGDIRGRGEREDGTIQELNARGRALLNKIQEHRLDDGRDQV